MNFNKFGKFIFPTVATLCTLDVLSSVYDDMSYYDLSYRESGNLDEAEFPHTVKNMCRSDVKMISAKGMLYRHEYMDYFVENKIDLRNSEYFPRYDCNNDDSLKRKQAEATEYLEKNFESLQNDYKDHLDKAKKYLLSESSYEIKNANGPNIEYEHALYKDKGRVKLDLENLVSSFSIEEASGKPFDQLVFYIEPSQKQIDLISKLKDWSEQASYRVKMNLKLGSLKDFMRHGCNADTKTDRGSLGLLNGTVVSSDSACIATKLVDGEINIIKYDSIKEEYQDEFTNDSTTPYARVSSPDDEKLRWKLVASIPIKWE